MLLLHEVHTVAGRHEDEFEGRVPRRLDADAREGRRRAAPLLPAPRARHGPGVPHGHDHGAARRRRVRTARDARAARRPAQLGGRRRPAAPRGARASCCCPSTGHRCRTSTSRPFRPTAASTTRCSTWKTARGRTKSTLDTLPREGAHALRAEPRGAHRTLAADAARRVPGRARRAAPPRSGAVAARRLPRAAPRAVHARASRAREGPGHVDARRARSARRLGEPPAAQRALVARSDLPPYGCSSARSTQLPARLAIAEPRRHCRISCSSMPFVRKQNDAPVSGSAHAIWPAAPLWPNVRAETVRPMPRTCARSSSPFDDQPARAVGGNAHVVGERVAHVRRDVGQHVGLPHPERVVQQRLVEEREVGRGRHAAAARARRPRALGPVERRAAPRS